MARTRRTLSEQREAHRRAQAKYWEKKKQKAAQHAAFPPNNAPIPSQSVSVAASSSAAPVEQQGLASMNVDQSSDRIRSARVDKLPPSSINPIQSTRVNNDSLLVQNLIQQSEPHTSSKPQSAPAQMPDEPSDAASDLPGMGTDLGAKDVLRLMGGLPFRQSFSILPRHLANVTFDIERGPSVREKKTTRNPDPPRRKTGRPRKNPTRDPDLPRRQRGRPRKNPTLSTVNPAENKAAPSTISDPPSQQTGMLPPRKETKVNRFHLSRAPYKPSSAHRILKPNLPSKPPDLLRLRE